MKKTQKHLFFHGRTVKLYRDTIEEVLEIVTEHCETVTISSGDYEYDSLDELESKRGKDNLKQIEIKGRTPYIYFHASRGMNGRSWVSADGEGAETPYLLISTLLSEHKRKWLHLVFHPFACLLYVLILTSLIIILASRLKFQIPLSIIILVLYGVPMALIPWLAIATHRGELSYITLKRKHEKSSFWIRNKDKVLVGVIVAIVTAFVTWLITYLTSK